MIVFYASTLTDANGHPKLDEEGFEQPGMGIYRMSSIEPFGEDNPIYMFDGATPEDASRIAEVLNEQQRIITRLACQINFGASDTE